MKNLFITQVLLFMLTHLSSSSLQAISITGNVKIMGGIGIEGAKVTFINQNSNEYYVMFSDSNGSYSLAIETSFQKDMQASKFQKFHLS